MISNFLFNKKNKQSIGRLSVMMLLCLSAKSSFSAQAQDEPFFYRKWRGCDLLGNISHVEGADRVHVNTSRPECLVYGPYIDLPRGMYEATFVFNYNGEHDSYVFDVAANCGQNILKEHRTFSAIRPRGLWSTGYCFPNMPKSPFTLTFFTHHGAKNVEFRIYYNHECFCRKENSVFRLHAIYLNRIFDGDGYALFKEMLLANKPEVGRDKANHYLITQENAKKEQFREEGRNELRPALEAEQAAKNQLAQQVLDLTRRVAELEAYASGLSGQVHHLSTHAESLDSALNQERGTVHQLSQERDDARSALNWHIQQNAQAISDLERQKNELSDQMGSVRGELTQAQQENLEKQAELQRKIRELNSKQAEIRSKTEDLRLQHQRISSTKDQVRKLIAAHAAKDRIITNAVRSQRSRSSSIARRSDLALSRLEIHELFAVKSLALFAKEGGQEILVGRAGGSRGIAGTKCNLVLSDSITKIRVGSAMNIKFDNREVDGVISGFSFTFSSGKIEKYGMFSSPYTEINLDQDERLIGLCGVADEYVQMLGFITNKKEYGPYGDNTDGEWFTIDPISGKL